MTTSYVQSGSLAADLQDFPGMIPPPGVIPNFDNPYSRGGTFTAVGTIIIVAMVIFVTCKLYTKTFIVRKPSWDDLTCLLGAVAAIAYYTNCLYEVKHGRTGIHQWNVRASFLASDAFLIPSYLGTILVPPAMILTKMTFFLMYLQIFWPFKWLRACVYLGATVSLVFYLVAEIFWLYYMTPRKGETFLSVVTSAAEFKVLVLSVPVAAVGLGIDVYLLVLPITAVMHLQLPTRRKIGVILVFLTGIAACVSSALSVYYRTLLNRNADVTWNLLSVNILSLAEMSIGLCCVSMPAMSKMLNHHLPPYEKMKSWFSSRFVSTDSTPNSHSSLEKASTTGRKLLFGKMKTPNRSRESYVDIERSDPALFLPDAFSAPDKQGLINKPVRTYINSKKSDVTNDNKIHCEIELQQHTRQRDSR